MFLKNQKLLFLLVVFLGLVLGSVVFSYNDVTTHPKLTREVIDFYNKEADKKITDKQVQWIIEGAIEEDSPILRCKNHFYNPQTSQGLSDGKYGLAPGIPAPKWSDSSVDQSKPYYGGDYSWQSAIYHYQQENYKKAFLSLGHVLHLLEDMAVPAHVRNDAHEEGDPYESWAKENNQTIGIGLSQAKRRDCTSEKRCLKNLAKYTNNNFLSKDTTDRYKGLVNKEKIYLDEDDYLIINGLKIGKFISKDNQIVFDEKVHQSYWNHLSPKAAGYGAGLIELFFEKVEGEKVEKPETVAEYIVNQTKNKVVAKTQETKDKIWNTGKVVKDSFKNAWDWTSDKLVFWQEDSTSNQEKGVRNDRDEDSEKTPKDNKNKKQVLASREESKISEEDSGSQPETVNQTEDTENNQESGEEDSEASQTLEPEIDLASSPEPNKKPGREVGVKFVYDGDTILLESGEKVRYLGIDAPELNEAGKEDDECMAWEAKARNMKLLERDDVRIVKDPGVNKDKYGRLLRYVYLGEEFLNRTLVREGLAEPFFCQPGWENCAQTADKQRKEAILEAHQYAKSHDLGIYSSDCVFDKDRKQIAKKDSEKQAKEEKTDQSSKKEPENNQDGKQEEEKTEPQKEKINIHILGGGDPAPEKEKEKEEKNQNHDQDQGGETGEKDKEKKEENIKPPEIALAEKPDSITSSTVAGFKLNLENASSTYYKLDGEKAALSTSTIELKNLSEGEHEFIAVATNTSESIASTSHTWTIDRTAELPEITNLTPVNGIYWLDSSKLKLKGKKNPDISEISLLVSSPQSSTTRIFTTSSRENTWEISHNFNFPCSVPESEVPNIQSRLSRKIGCFQRKGLTLDEISPERIRDFSIKKVYFKVKDDLGNTATGSELTFIRDNLAPNTYPKGEIAKDYSRASNQTYFSYSLIDELGKLDKLMPFPFPDSGIKEIKWYKKTATSVDWQKIEPSHTFRTNKFIEVVSSGFTLTPNQKHSILLEIEDNAGNIATSATQITTIKPYPVISEVYANASSSEYDGEWLELYNPGDKEVSLAGYTIEFGLGETVSLPATSTIPANGYFLIGNKGWQPDDPAWPDPDYKEEFGLNNSGEIIRITNKNGEEVDRWKYSNPKELKSFERKACLRSTPDKMASGGAHHDKGNGWDTNENSEDFIIKENPEPQNSSSTPEEWSF